MTTVEGTAVNGQVEGYDPDGNEVRFYLSRPPAHGSVTGLPPGPFPGQEGSLRGDFIYRPVTGYVGADSFGFVANDGDWNSSEGRVSISISPRGLSLRMAATAGSTTADRSDRWLPISHDLHDGGNRLYALDLSGRAPPILIDEADAGARITGAGWFNAAHSIFFRRNGALFFWSPVAGGPAQVVAPTIPGHLLGDIVLTSDGSRLAFVSAARASGRGAVYVLDGDGTAHRVVLPATIVAPAWPHHLAFVDDGAALQFDVAGQSGAARCELIATLAPARKIDSLVASTSVRGAGCGL